MWHRAWVLTGIALLGACGGGGPNQEKSSRELAQMCSADNPLRAGALSATRTGTLADERQWIKAYLQERYYWYRDIVPVNPNDAAYNVKTSTPSSNFLQSVSNYFYAQLNPKFTARGVRVDPFSFMTPTDSWTRLTQGYELGYGWLLQDSGTGTSRRIRVAHVYPTSQAGSAATMGILRGDEILSVNGVPVSSPQLGSLVDGWLSPSSPGVHDFVVQRGGQPFPVRLTASNTVMPQAEHRVVTDSQQVKWGYLLFNAHFDSAKEPLRAALTEFKRQQVQQLVVDLRYNGGGYLALASVLAYGIAGEARTRGKTFERILYSDKRTSSNENIPFYSVDADGRSIDALNLSKVYVLTTDSTCSASESLINGLRGVDVEVVQIGGTTCGKPYGFLPQDNCGITYGAVEFEGVNHKGQGGYANGLVPQCAAQDNLTQLLGQPNEPLFAVAIAHHRGFACRSAQSSQALSSTGAVEGWGQIPHRIMRSDGHNDKFWQPTR